MIDIVYDFLKEFVNVLIAMSPWLLLGFAVAGALHVFIPDKFVVKHLSGRGLRPIINASLLGVPLPLCSCSVIPVGASLHRRGSGPGATAGFLISTPQTGVDSILVTYSMMGPVFAVFRVLAAFFSGFIGGVWVDKVSPHDNAENATAAANSVAEKGNKIARAIHHGFVTLPGDLGKSLVLGLVIAAFITVLLPADILGNLPGGKAVTFAAMLLLGLPIYVCATASVPIAAALIMSQGVSPGAALVFLMTGPATNAATIIILKKMLGGKSIVAYLLSVMGIALIAGVLLDMYVTQFDSAAHLDPHAMHDQSGKMLEIISAIILTALMLRKYVVGLFSAVDTERNGKNDLKLIITGMTCPNCAAKVQSAIEQLPQVQSAKVTVDPAQAQISFNADASSEQKQSEVFVNLIDQLGYGAEVENIGKSCSGSCCEK